MKARFFHAPAAYRTWPKLFVLTEDNRFYCEYLNFMQPATVDDRKDFNSFKAEDYEWSGYQPIQEVDERTAKTINLTMQSNWVERYLDRLKASGPSPIANSSSLEERVLNRGGYFAAGRIKEGIHGPEKSNGKVYISIYHYLDFIGEDPRDYDTFNLGRALTDLSNGDYRSCKYDSQTFRINKFTLQTLQEHEGIFDDYLNNH